MLAATLQYAGLACYGATLILGEASVGNPPGEIMKVGGLLALVTFMIIQNYRQGDRMAKALDGKDEQMREANARAERLAVQASESSAAFKDAIVNLTAVLEKRPCAMAERDRPRIDT